MKYLIYLRVSTEEQDEETQLIYCLNFIRSHDPSNFKYEVFRDKITSREPIKEREGGSKMMAAIEEGDFVIAMRIDRLSRNLKEITDFVFELEKMNADVRLVDQPGMKNKIVLGLYAGAAEEEIKLLRKRVVEKLQNKKNRNERYSRFLPYGTRMHETKTVPIRVNKEIVLKRGVLLPLAEELEVMARMEELFVEGNSYQKIASALADQGYMNREGKPFHKMSVYRILARKGHTRSLRPPPKETVAHLWR